MLSDFCQGMKSVGHEIENLGRNIPEVAQQCLQDGAVVASDTDGYSKSYVTPTHEWVNGLMPQTTKGCISFGIPSLSVDSPFKAILATLGKPTQH